MRNQVIRIGAGCAVALGCAVTVAAQTPASSSVVVASPTYTFLPMEIAVDRPQTDDRFT